MIDISTLSATQLDELLLAAAEARMSRAESPIGDRPMECAAFGPAEWHTELVDVGSLFQIKHPGYGWLAFIIGHDHRALLIDLLTKQSLLAGQNKEMESSTAIGHPSATAIKH